MRFARWYTSRVIRVVAAAFALRVCLGPKWFKDPEDGCRGTAHRVCLVRRLASCLTLGVVQNRKGVHASEPPKSHQSQPPPQTMS
ncbi:hypothetical protein B0T25DRAFT_101980 [Lasiosphaeria hispida]|uniref:Secreted protein n=1 Tax=Lasiosphaeria hispida TaxID=260671 RepID=A0AAJ0HQE7_9PEZI|nr:hypothetical protein B0T25DRAFT_101980 [Lasiosphaeria hispida]